MFCRSLAELGLDRNLAYESYPWVEKQIVYKPVLNSWQTAVKNALLQVGVAPNNGYTYEHFYGTKISGIIFDKDGNRHTAAELLRSANPKNLDVLIHATVQKIVFDQSSGNQSILSSQWQYLSFPYLNSRLLNQM